MLHAPTSNQRKGQFSDKHKLDQLTLSAIKNYFAYLEMKSFLEHLWV